MPDVAVQKQVSTAERFVYVIEGDSVARRAAVSMSDARSATAWTLYFGRGRTKPWPSALQTRLRRCQSGIKQE